MGKASHVLYSPWTYVSFCVPLVGRVLVNAVILHRQVVHCLSCGIAAEAVLVESPEKEKQILSVTNIYYFHFRSRDFYYAKSHCLVLRTNLTFYRKPAKTKLNLDKTMTATS